MSDDLLHGRQASERAKVMGHVAPTAAPEEGCASQSWMRPRASLPFEVRELTPAGDLVRPFVNPLHVVGHLWRHRGLIGQLTRRDLASRYRGSFLGMLWSLLVPLVMLCVYTFVFSVVFRARWGLGEEGRALFALILFAGLVPFNIFSEVVSAAPGLMVGNPNYVKRVVFPLELLPLVKFLGALFHGFISAGVLVLGLLWARGTVHPTMALMPISWMPLLLITLGGAYFLAALGVFIRDTTQAVTILLPFLFFLSPIVYPLEAVPEQYRAIIRFNPISHTVEDARRTAIYGVMPDWVWFAALLFVSGLVALGGFLFFMKSKRAFHDVL